MNDYDCPHDREAIARILYNTVRETSNGYTEPIDENYSMDEVVTIDGQFNFIDLADAVIAALGPITEVRAAPGDTWECPACSADWVAKEAGPLDIRWELVAAADR